MPTTVSYKGDNIVTGLSGGSKILKTSGKYLEDDLTITDESVLQSKSINPTETQQVVSADNGYDALSSVTVNAISSNYVGSGIDRNDSSDITVSGDTVTVPSGFYEASVSKTVPESSATLITKNITSDGTYSAEDDNADGYSEVTVNVSGGGGLKVVSGTFKGTSTGSVLTVDVPYDGNGYPIIINVMPSVGAYNSAETFRNAILPYAIVTYSALKANWEVPDYSANSLKNRYLCSPAYKSSTSDGSSLAGTANTPYILSQDTPVQATGAKGTLLMPDNNTMKVFIGSYSGSNTVYFAANVDYNYYIVYSE